MAQPFLRHPDRHASQCQIGRVQVTELVKREARHARTLAQPRELALGQVVAVQRIPVGLAEDQVLVMIVGSKKTLLFDLHPLDLAQCLEHLWTELHSASPRLRLQRLPRWCRTSIVSGSRSSVPRSPTTEAMPGFCRRPEVSDSSTVSFRPDSLHRT